MNINVPPPAGAVHRMGHRAAGARDQGHGIRLDDRLGDFDGAALYSAGDQRRQYLQHDRWAGRCRRVIHIHRGGRVIHIHCAGIS